MSCTDPPNRTALPELRQPVLSSCPPSLRTLVSLLLTLTTVLLAFHLVR